jgi:hypothetical protein
VFGCSSRAGGGPLWYRYWLGVGHWRRQRQRSGHDGQCGRSPCERMKRRWGAWSDAWRRKRWSEKGVGPPRSEEEEREKWCGRREMGRRK